MRSTLRLMLDAGAVLIMGILLLGFPSSGTAQEEDPCLMCHSMAGMFQGDDTLRLVVTPQALEGSVHAPFGFSCSTCHQGMEFPHPENPRASCSPCHSELEALYAESLHGYALARGNERAPAAPPATGATRSSPARTHSPARTR